MNTALLLIDIQNDYFPGGNNPLAGSLEASLRAQAALAFFRQNRLPRVHIQHLSIRPGAKFFLPGTSGVDIHANVSPLPGEIIVQKNYPNSFRDTGLCDLLAGRQISRLVICGMMTHMCVEATTRAAYDLGFDCTVLHDACATKALAFQEQTVPAAQVQAAFLAGLSGTYARVVSVEEFLADVC